MTDSCSDVLIFGNRTKYGYDAIGNRLYDQPLLKPEHARWFTYDGLNRLTDSQMGVLDNVDAPTGPAGAPYASPRNVDPTYDLLGNFVQDKVNSHVETRTHNTANEILTRSVPDTAVDPGQALYLNEQFSGPSPLGNWEDMVGSFTVTSGAASVNGTASDDTATPWSSHTRALMVVKNLTSLADIAAKVDVTLPAGGYGGIVFGYERGNKYLVFLVQCVQGGSQAMIYRKDGDSAYSWSLMTTPASVSAQPGQAITLSLLVQGRYVAGYVGQTLCVECQDVDVAPGRIGVLASSSSTLFDNLQVRRIDWPAPALPGWQVQDCQFGLGQSGGRDVAAIQAQDGLPYGLAVREGFWEQDCAVEATIKADAQAGVAFRIRDRNNYWFVTAMPVLGLLTLIQVADGVPSLAAIADPPVTVDWSQWHGWRVRCQGADLDMWLEVNSTWYQVFDGTDPNSGQGVLGTSPWPSGAVGLACTFAPGMWYCDDFRAGYDTDRDGVIDYPAVADGFDASSATVQPAYDAAGNLTDDGLYIYEYDAWNHLICVQRKTYTINSYRCVAMYAYDGLGRRVYKHVLNSGDRNTTQYFYYNQKWQLLEIRNGDDKPRQQFVWGTQYIDEAICMDVDTDSSGSGYGNCTDTGGSRRFFYMQDANYNVIALREAGTIVERYEYDPYGQVRVVRGWATESEDGSVAGESLKWLDANLPSNPILYCGYFHDWETGLDQVRYRMYSNRLGRWMQRDPLAYTDSLSLYLYAGGRAVDSTDPQGLLPTFPDWTPPPPPPPPGTQPTTQPTTQPCSSKIRVGVQGVAKQGWLLPDTYAIYLEVWGESKDCCSFAQTGDTTAEGRLTFASPASPITKITIDKRRMSGKGGPCNACCTQSQGSMETYTVTADYVFFQGLEGFGAKLGNTVASGTISITVYANGTYTVNELQGVGYGLWGSFPMVFETQVLEKATCTRPASSQP